MTQATSVVGARALSDDGEMPTARRMLNTAVNVTETLTIIASDPHGVPAKLLARRLGQSLSTTYYALQTLTSVGLVEPSPSAPGLYTLGPRIAELYRGYVANRTLPERLTPILAELRTATTARAYLAAWTSGDMEVTQALGRRGATELQDVSSGFRGGAHALAIGKVLLAATRPERWPAYLCQSRLEAFTPATISTPGQLHAELQRVREQGFATDDEEFRDKVSCVAAPVYDSAGRVLGAMGISVPPRRFHREIGDLVAAVRSSAREASEMFSGLDPLTALVRQSAEA
jgi:IclR family transcriptional regulator, acetate operon repressor